MLMASLSSRKRTQRRRRMKRANTSPLGSRRGRHGRRRGLVTGVGLGGTAVVAARPRVPRAPSPPPWVLSVLGTWLQVRESPAPVFCPSLFPRGHWESTAERWEAGATGPGHQGGETASRGGLLSSHPPPCLQPKNSPEITFQVKIDASLSPPPFR